MGNGTVRISNDLRLAILKRDNGCSPSLGGGGTDQVLEIGGQGERTKETMLSDERCLIAWRFDAHRRTGSRG